MIDDDEDPWEIVGWQDMDGNRHEGVPPPDVFGDWGGNMGHIDGVLIRSWTPHDRDSVEYHWVYQAGIWRTWNQMAHDIDESIDMYEMTQG